MLMALQSVFKPIEEVNESEQDRENHLKHEPRGDQRKEDIYRKGKNSYGKPGKNHEWEDSPGNRYGHNYRGDKSHVNKERQIDASQEIEVTFEDNNEINWIKEYKSDNDEGSLLDLVGRSLPDLVGRYDSDLEVEEDSDGDGSLLELAAGYNLGLVIMCLH